jgi:two-component system, OmpR family, sensor histidine kinase KdpD
VLVNLLENAAKYTPADATVQLIARSVDQELRVTVADNGPGIPPGHEEDIFNKFTRGVRESSITGVGLGLAICKAIVEAHGGTISALNRAGRGAAFTFTLPLTSEQPITTGEEEDVRVTE